MCLKTCNKCRVKKPEKDFPIESGRGYRKTTCRLCFFRKKKHALLKIQRKNQGN